MHFEEIKQLEGFVVIEKVAEGGFGKVYKVKDKEGNIFALKCAPPESVPILKEEFGLLSQLNHPSIVKVFQFIEPGNMGCYTMEFFSGKSIMKFFKPPLRDKERFKILRKVLIQVLHTLSYIHRSGFIFGDLTPKHIIIKEDANPVLIDIAGKQGIGTPGYVAPECIYGYVSPQSDIYSLGIILYELLTGKKAFSGKSETDVIINNLKESLKDVREINPSVPKDIERIVMKMCEKDIYIRYRSVDEVISALTDTKYKGEPIVSFYTRLIGRDNVIQSIETYFQNVKAGEQIYLQIYGGRGIGKTRLLNEVIVRGILSGFTPISLKDIMKKPETLKVNKKTYLIYSDGEETPYVIKDFYNQLKKTYKDIPVIFILTGENELPFVQNRIKLHPLTKEDIDELIGISLGEVLNKNAFINAMEEKTGGNPYLLISSLKYLIHSKILGYKDGKWVMDKSLILNIPEDITEFFHYEIGQLNKEDREVMELCATAGKRFPLKIIDAIKGEKILSSIVKMKNKGYINSDGDMYYWINNEFRIYILSRMDKQKREEWAGKIYKISRGIKGIPAEIMAEYAVNAGDKIKAREYLIEGADKLLAQSNPAGAFPLYKRAYEIKQEDRVLDRILDAGDKSGLYQDAISISQSMKRKSKKIDILLKMARLYRKSGKTEEARGIYEKIDVQKLPCDKVYEIANFYLRDNEWGRAVSIFNARMEECRENPKFLYGYAILLHSRKEYTELQRVLDEGIETSKGDKRLYASFLGIKSLALLDRGEFSQAYHQGMKAYKIFKSLNDKQNIGILLINLGYIQIHRGIMDKAEAYLKEGMGYFQALNDMHNFLKVCPNLVIVERHRGNFTEVERLAKSYRFNPEDEEKILYNLGLIYIYQGRFSKSEKIIERIKEDEAGKYELLGILSCEREKYADAEKYLKMARKLYKEEDRKDEVDILMADVMGRMGKKTKGLLNALNKRIKGNNYLQNLIKRQIIYREFKEGWEGEIKKVLDVFHYRGYIFEYARTLFIQGKMLIKDGRYREALKSLMEARDIFEHIPAKLYKKRVEEKIIEAAKGILQQRPGTAYIEHLNLISSMFEKIDNYHQLIRDILHTVMRLMDAERGIIFLKTEKGEIFPAHSIGIEKDKDVEVISFTAIRETMEGHPVVVMDAAKDKRFKAFHSVKLNKIVSILSVPIKAQDRIIGSIYIDSRIKKSIFSEIDEKYLFSLSRLMGNILKSGRLIEALKEREREENGFHHIIGTSPVMQKIYDEIKKIALLDINILITGETGTGKELIARTIHNLSKRREGKILTIDCSALPENILESELFGHTKGAFTGAVENKAGLFEEADGGTVFLDEIGDAPPNVQGELLRVIEKGEIRRLGETKWRKVDVRVIAATNKEIEFEVSIKRFREDLYYRLNAFRMHIPPLRERENDVLLIADYFLKKVSKTMGKKVIGFSREVKDIFLGYPWPGNVRELRNAIERGVALTDGEIIGMEDIPDEIRDMFSRGKPAVKRKKKVTKDAIVSALKKYPTKKEAARALGISRRHLHRLIKEYKIDTE